jgi:hypothetical protein
MQLGESLFYFNQGNEMIGMYTVCLAIEEMATVGKPRDA